MLLVQAGSAWLLGLILAPLTPLKIWQWSALATNASSSALLSRTNLRFRSLFILLLILFLGAARWVSSIPSIDQDQVAFYADTGHDVQLTGRIEVDPDVHDNQTRLSCVRWHGKDDR